MKRPADDLTAFDVSRSDRQSAAVARRRDDGFQVSREMGSVGVHLDEEVRSVGQSTTMTLWPNRRTPATTFSRFAISLYVGRTTRTQGADAR